MSRQRFREPWFPISCLYYQNGKVRDGGAGAAICHQYLLAINKTKGCPDDGAQSIAEWEPRKIWRWLGVMQEKFSLDEIVMGMTAAEEVALVERLETPDGEFVRPNDYEDFSFGVARDAAADRKARERKQRSGDGRTKSPTDSPTKTDKSGHVATKGDKSAESHNNRTVQEKEDRTEEGSAPAPVDYQNVYDGETENDAQKIVALIMAAWDNWPQDQVEPSVMRLRAADPGLTLDEWTAIIKEAHRTTRPGKPSNELHTWLARQVSIYKKDQAMGGKRETPQQRERREQIEAADKRLKDAEEREQNDGDGALRTKGRATFP